MRAIEVFSHRSPATHPHPHPPASLSQELKNYDLTLSKTTDGIFVFHGVDLREGTGPVTKTSLNITLNIKIFFITRFHVTQAVHELASGLPRAGITVSPVQAYFYVFGLFKTVFYCAAQTCLELASPEMLKSK